MTNPDTHTTPPSAPVQPSGSPLADELLFRSLFDHHAAVNLLIDPRTGRIIDANEAAARFYGCSPSPRAAIFSCPCTP